MEMGEIERLIERFLSGDDTSLSAANSLETLLDDAFPDVPLVQDVVAMLAQYRPFGGDLLFAEADLQKPLRAVQKHLAAL